VCFAFFGCGEHLESKLRRNGWRQSKTICVKSLLLNVNFSSSSLDFYGQGGLCPPASTKGTS